jgi:uncharacterized Zn-binding protein involved in type VI secretion
MGQAVCRKGDSSTGHGAFYPKSSTQGSTDVFINGIGAHRNSDAWSIHCDPEPSCHGSVLSGGSGTVFVNGKPLGRVGDDISCGDVVATGSPNVFAG